MHLFLGILMRQSRLCEDNEQEVSRSTVCRRRLGWKRPPAECQRVIKMSSHCLQLSCLDFQPQQHSQETGVMLISFSFLLQFITLSHVNVGVCLCLGKSVEVRGQLLWGVCFPMPPYSQGGMQIFRLGSKSVYPLSHPSGFYITF